MKILNRFVLTAEPVGWQKARALFRWIIRAYIPLALFWCILRWPLLAMGVKWLVARVDGVFICPWLGAAWLLNQPIWDKWTLAYLLQMGWLAMLFFVWLPMCAVWVGWRIWTACEFIAPRSR